MNENELNELSEKIIGAAIEVHRQLGPGLLEHIYQAALIHELSLRGINAETEVKLPCTYKSVILPVTYRADIVVEKEIILELKSTDCDNKIYFKQLYSYLKLSDKRLGLLINFHRDMLINGITRIVNNL
ncbi:MAG: GxxExxY protein [Muribaculaceae bacterium]|nr:GxxExxY protein [Muribaculaceae bacterium]